MEKILALNFNCKTTDSPIRFGKETGIGILICIKGATIIMLSGEACMKFEKKQDRNLQLNSRWALCKVTSYVKKAGLDRGKEWKIKRKDRDYKKKRNAG